MAGKAALEAAVDGQTAKMVAFKREEGEEYICKTILVDLSEVANVEKTIPREWINKEGNDVLKAFIDYALPLVQGETEMKYENGLPRFARLKKIKAKATFVKRIGGNSMALVTTKGMFAKAINSDYAIGAFNVNNMELSRE